MNISSSFVGMIGGFSKGGSVPIGVDEAKSEEGLVSGANQSLPNGSLVVRVGSNVGSIPHVYVQMSAKVRMK